MNAQRTVETPPGDRWPVLGLGTAGLGERNGPRAGEIAAVREAFDIGYRLVDTAEMYGDGGAEEVVGEAVAGALRAGGLRREDLIVVSKVYPHHASERGVVEACARSLKRLQLDHLDLYLLHWRGNLPLAETVAGFEALRTRGWIRRWGVSNFDVDDLRELGDADCAANQVYFSLSARGPEFDLLPWQRERRMPLMAYSPLDVGALANHRGLRGVAGAHAATPAQIALAWVLHQPGVLAIPKAAQPRHLKLNWAAAKIRLTGDELAELDRAFPPPRCKLALAMR
jgi:diketogulonate reductase-like aldo/keto reductase